MDPIEQAQRRSVKHAIKGKLANGKKPTRPDKPSPHPKPTLGALRLSPSVLKEGSPLGTDVGTLSGMLAGSKLTLVDGAGERFQLVGSAIQAGSIATAYDVNSSHSLIIRETHADASNSPRDTVLPVAIEDVADEPQLAVLSGSFSLPENANAGVPAGTIRGMTEGSTLSLKDDAGGRVQLDGTTIVAGATLLDFETAASHSFAVRETRPNSPNSPRDTVFTLNVSDVADGPVLAALSGSFVLPESAVSSAVAGNIEGITAGSTLLLVDDAGGVVRLAGSSLVAGDTPLDYESATSHSFTIRESLTGSPNSPRETVLTLNVTDVADGPELAPLSGSFVLPEGAVSGAVAGSIEGITAGATLSLVDDAGGRVRLAGSSIVAGDTPLDYESATNHNFTIRESLTGSPNSPRETVFTLNVTDVVEADVNAPTIISASLISVAENAQLAHTLAANEAVTWSIIAKLDAAKFEIVSGNILRWAGDGTKNFEAPEDSDSDNVYLVTVRATDAAGNSAEHTIATSVLDQDELVDQFTFADIDDATLSTVFRTPPKLVGGLGDGVSVPASAEGGVWYKNGVRVADEMTLANGDTYEVEGTSSAAHAEAVNVKFNIGAISDTFTITTAAEALGNGPAPYAVFVTSDQDSRAGEERDDNIANIYGLLRQDIFNLTGWVANEPNGLATSYADMFAAYEAVRPSLLTKYPGLEHRFKTKAELDPLVTQGPTNDAPTAGYRTAEVGVQDTGAKRLIAAAVAHGDPTTDWQANPKSKLWYFCMGGYSVLAQACHEAIELGAQPDFLERIVVVGYVTYNAKQSQNAWNYLINGYGHGNGKFGNLTMINGMQNWYYFSSQDAPIQPNYWNNYIRPAGAIGDYMDSVRLNSGYSGLRPHAGDAGGWLWLADAHERSVFDPIKPGNVGGRFQIDSGNAPNWGITSLWPALQSWGPTIYNASSPAEPQIARFGEMLQQAFSGVVGRKAVPQPVKGLVFEGDSLTQQQASATASYPSQFGKSTGLATINRATNGHTFATMDSQYATDVAVHYNASTANWLVVLGGTNDLANGTSAADLQKLVQSVVGKAKASGFSVALGTILPRSDANWSMAKEAERVAFNAWLRSSTLPDLVIDFEATAVLSDPANATYFAADRLHLTEAGNASLAEQARIAMNLPLVPRDALTPTVFGSDDFKRAGSILESKSPSGHDWARVTGTNSNLAQIENGYVRGGSATAPNFYRLVVTPSSADYWVKGTLRLAGAGTTNQHAPGLLSRCDTTGSANYYRAELNDTGMVNLRRQLDGRSSTVIASFAAKLALDVDYTVELLTRGTVPVHLEVWIAGGAYTIRTKIIEFDDTDASRITSAGQPGITLRQHGRHYAFAAATISAASNDALTPSLSALVGTFTLPEDAVAGTMAGAISGLANNSTLSLVDDAGARVALSGNNVVRGATPLDYETATSHTFIVRETFGGTVTPAYRDAQMTLNVVDVVESTPSGAMFALSSSGNPALRSASAWVNDVMEVPVTGALDGAAYQLAFTLAGGTDSKSDYFTLEASNADGTAIHDKMSGRVSHPSNKHTFDFIAPSGMTKIVLRRQPGFTGTVTFQGVKRIMNTGEYAMPAPKAVYCEPKAGNKVKLTWWTDMAASLDHAQADISRQFSDPKFGEMSNRVKFTAGSPTIATVNSTMVMPAGTRVYFVESNNAVQPGGIPFLPTLLYIRKQNLTSRSFEVSLSPPDANGNDVGPALVATGTGADGAEGMRVQRYDRTFRSFKQHLPNQDEVFSLQSFKQAFARGQIATKTSREGGATKIWNMSTLGKRHGGWQGKVSQLSLYGPFAYLDSYVSTGMNSHLGRYNRDAQFATVTISQGNPAIVAGSFGGVSSTHEVRFATTGSLPAPLQPGTVYFAQHQASGQIKLSLKPGNHQPPIATTTAGSGTHTLEIMATANANIITPEGNPLNEEAPGIIANIYAENASDAVVDSKHPNLWVSNMTYAMPTDMHYATHRALMAHDYTFSGEYASKGLGIIYAQGCVMPDMRPFDGQSYPIRMENGRCYMPIFNMFIGGEKIVSRAQMKKRDYLYELSPGQMTEAHYPVYSMPIPDAPDEAKWPVLAVAVQVRKSGTNTWHEVPLPYTGPFPAGALQWEINPVGIGGIAAGNGVDVRLGHYDGATWKWAGSDGVAAFETMTLIGS